MESTAHQIQFKHATNTFLKGKTAEVKLAKYDLGGTAILLENHREEISLKLSVYMAGEYIGINYAFIKTWGENEGVMEDAIEAGIIESPIAWIPAGYAKAALCRILIDIPEDEE